MEMTHFISSFVFYVLLSFCIEVDLTNKIDYDFFDGVEYQQ